jgi:hypothetical protein
MTTSRSTPLIFGLAFFGFFAAAVPAVVNATDTAASTQADTPNVEHGANQT